MISKYKSFTSNPEDTTIEKTIDDIAGGKYKRQIETLRKYEKGDSKYSEEKKRLPHFTASGAFLNRRKADDLYKYSHCIVLDIDEILNPESLKKELITDPHTHFAFISPGGMGLKVWVKVDSQKEYHQIAFNQLVAYFEQKYGIEVDKSGKDVSRACFYSYDPFAYYDPSSEIFNVDVNTDHSPLDDVEHNKESTIAAIDYIFSHIDKEARRLQSEDGRNNHCHQFACICNRKGLDQVRAAEYFVKQYQEKDFTRSEIENTISGVYKRNLNEYAVQSEYHASPLAFQPTSSGTKLSSTDLHKIYEEVRAIKKEEIPEEKPLIKRNFESTVFKNSIVVIQGKKGSFKSRFAQSLLASVLKPRILCLNNNLGLKCQNIGKTVGVYIDTERNLKHQLPAAIQEIQNIVCVDRKKDPANLEYTSLVNIPREKRLKKLQLYLRDLQEKHEGKHLLVVIDVVTDLCQNFNDPVESMMVIDYLNNMINNENCTFLCVIHENPGIGSKARGHTGTELGNKATTQLQVKKIDMHAGKRVRIRYLKCRNTEQYPDFYAKYDADSRRLVEVKDAQVLDDNTQLKVSPQEICKYLANLDYPSDRKELLNDIADVFDISKRTAHDRITKIVDKQYPIVVDDEVYYLHKNKSRAVTYELKPIDENAKQVDDPNVEEEE